MYPKRMKNKSHGFTHVYDSGEEANIRVHGWIDEAEAFPGEAAEVTLELPAVEEVQAIQEPASIDAEVAVKKRPGRKPKA